MKIIKKPFQLNQNSELIINLKPGEHVWAFTTIKGTYVLAADLFVTNTQDNPPGHKYGAYCVIGDKQRSRYFNVFQHIDFEPIVRKIFPQAPCRTKTGRSFGLGSFFQGTNGVRRISPSDEQLLVDFSSLLTVI